MPKTITDSQRQLIATLNHEARQIPPREGELDRPLEWDEDRAIWTGFFLNYDDGRGLLLARLKRAGFVVMFYDAPYHWKLQDNLGRLQLEYVEGDLYAKAL